MNTVSSQIPANLFLPQTLSTLRVQAAELQSFRVQQQMLATVVEINEEEGEAVLEIGGKNYRTPLNDTMQSGQLLQLQVLKTEPALEFNVLGVSKQDQLAQLFTLLAQPYDWAKLAEQIQRLAKDSPELSTLANLFRQFRQVVAPGQKLPDEIADAIKVLTRQLQALNAQETRPDAAALLPGFELVMKRPQKDSPAALHSWARLLTQLKDHIGRGQQLPDAKDRGQWYGQTRELLGELQTVVKGQALSASLLRGLSPLLNQLQQLTPVTPQLARDIRLLDNLVQKTTATGVLSQDFVSDDRQSARIQQVGGRLPLSAGPTPESTAALPVTGAATREGAVALPTGAAEQLIKTDFHAEPATVPPPSLDKLVRQVVTLLRDSEGTVALPGKIVGQLEGALARSIEKGQIAAEHLPYVNNLLQQLSNAPATLAPETFREKLGVLSLLLGFGIDKIGKEKSGDTKASLLQQSLYALKDQLTGKGDEPLQRLELLQLCRDKLADQQVQFFPLPFEDLEEGYLLVRQHSYKDGSGSAKDDPREELQLSMALRLSAIGSVRVDMLYGVSGLRLQLAGENRQKMHYLETFAADLRGALSGIKLLSIGFRDDAQLPTMQLKQNVLPEADRLLNMRV